MIDWVSAVIPLKHTVINDGFTFKVDRDGTVVRQRLDRLAVRGSYDSTIVVKTQNLDDSHQHGAELYIDGNPSKFLQGHNVCGSDDICLLVAETVKRVLEADAQQLDAFTYKRIASGKFTVKRVDINYQFELPSHTDVKAWIAAASVQSTLRFRGKPQLRGNTLYWGLGSTTWFIKAYSKFIELTNGKKNHRLPRELLNTPLLPYSENKLRIELQLRKELNSISKKLFNTDSMTGDLLTPDLCRQLFNEYLERIDMNANVALKDDKLLKLPNHLRATYAVWRDGHDVKSMLSHPTFYRQRKELMDLYSIDISLPRSTSGETLQTNVVQLVRPLTAIPAAIPENLKQYCYGV